MKVTTAILSAALATGAVARPRYNTRTGETLPQYSRITAFVVDERGFPSVECWEIGNLVEDASAHGHKAVSLAQAGKIDSFDVLTIQPDGNTNAAAKKKAGFGFDVGLGFNLFNVQGGLVGLSFRASEFAAKGDDDNEFETHIFSLENGDDWFYFEDNVSDSAKAKTTANPVHAFFPSASEAELLRLGYSSQPKHKVVHKGACSFTGIHVDEDSNKGVTVQVNMDL